MVNFTLSGLNQSFSSITDLALTAPSEPDVATGNALVESTISLSSNTHWNDTFFFLPDSSTITDVANESINYKTMNNSFTLPNIAAVNCSNLQVETNDTAQTVSDVVVRTFSKNIYNAENMLATFTDSSVAATKTAIDNKVKNDQTDNTDLEALVQTELGDGSSTKTTSSTGASNLTRQLLLQLANDGTSSSRLDVGNMTADSGGDAVNGYYPVVFTNGDTLSFKLSFAMSNGASLITNANAAGTVDVCYKITFTA